MDEQKPSTDVTADEADPASKPSGGQVMDIQTPKPTNDAENSNSSSPEVTTDASHEESMDESSSTGGAEGSADTTDSSVSDNTADGSVASSDSSASEEPNHNPLAIPPQPAAKSTKPTLVIIVAIIVALILAGLVVFMFMKTKKETTGTNKPLNSSTTETAAKPLASPADVDATSKDLETNLNKVDDSKDFPATDLSDKTLGL